MPMTSREMISYLKKNGFEVISQNGSHVKMSNPLTGKTVIVPYHCKDLKKGTHSKFVRYIHPDHIIVTVGMDIKLPILFYDQIRCLF